MVSMGLCLCRYAYAPLIPAMIAEGWVDKAGAGYLGGFNALGYLGGAIVAILLPKHLSLGLILRVSIVTVFLSLLMCAWNLGFAWLATARTLTGLAGAVLVIHAPSLALAPVPQRWKKFAGGAIFAGAGFTILMISLALPGFLETSVGSGWLLEAGVALAVGTVAWPLAASAQTPTATARRKSHLTAPQAKSLRILGSAYFLAGVGITPHTLFLTDYLHRDLHVAQASSIYYYSLIGLGSFCGALAGGAAARMLGTRQSLSANYLLGTAAVVLVLNGDGPIWISLSVFGIGFFLLACVALLSQRTAEIAGAADHPRYWGILTLVFGVGITVGSYALAWLIDVGWSYRSTFVIAALSLALGLLLSLGPGLRTQQPAADS